MKHEESVTILTWVRPCIYKTSTEFLQCSFVFGRLPLDGRLGFGTRPSLLHNFFKIKKLRYRVWRTSKGWQDELEAKLKKWNKASCYWSLSFRPPPPSLTLRILKLSMTTKLRGQKRFLWSPQHKLMTSHDERITSGSQTAVILDPPSWNFLIFPKPLKSAKIDQSNQKSNQSQ